jgi:hypothetical protein
MRSARKEGKVGGSSVQAASAVIVMLLALLAPPGVHGEITLFDNDTWGQMSMTGFLRSQVDIRTGGRNPANIGRVNDTTPTLHMMRQWNLNDITYTPPWRGWKLFLRTRAWWDSTQEAEGQRTPGGADFTYDAFPTKFRGDGWFLRASSKQVAFELWEAWVQYESDEMFVRAGRQVVVWGDVAPSRVLDTVNPLDLSWHLLNELSGREAFDHLRIPLWTLRASYSPRVLQPLIPGATFEGFIIPGDFVSTQTPAPGSPQNLIPLLPPFISLRDDIASNRRGVFWGARFVGNWGGLNYSLNYLDRRLDNGVTRLVGITPDPLSPIGVDLDLRQTHPRYQTVGVSANYFSALLKSVLRVEAVWDNRFPFENLENNMQIRRRDQYHWVIALDRPTFVFRSDRTMSITLQYEQFLRERGRGNIGSAGAPVDSNNETFTVLLSQPWRGWGGRGDEWFTDLVLIADTDDAFFIQPAVRFQPGNHWRFDLWYNLFTGSETRPARFGSLDPFQGVNMAVSYQY